jgi:transposase
LESLSRFASPSQLMGYSGLVSRDHTSGNRVQRGVITKNGDAHLRRVRVEAAWAYRHRPNVRGQVLRRQKSLGPQRRGQANRLAQQRQHKRFTTLTARDKKNSVGAIAIARELLGFMWSIAVHTEAQHKQAKTA